MPSSKGIFPTQDGLASPVSPAIAGRSFTAEPLEPVSSPFTRTDWQVPWEGSLESLSCAHWWVCVGVREARTCIRSSDGCHV